MKICYLQNKPHLEALFFTLIKQHIELQISQTQPGVYIPALKELGFPLSGINVLEAYFTY